MTTYFPNRYAELWEMREKRSEKKNGRYEYLGAGVYTIGHGFRA